MKLKLNLRLYLVIITSAYTAGASAQIVNLKLISRYETGIYDESATEIAAYDAETQRLFSVNGFTGDVEVINLSDLTIPVLEFIIDLEPFGAGANSVSAKNGIIAIAVEDTNKQANGKAIFFNANGNFISAVEVGALPDMITFTPDGQKVLTANEGEPNDDYTVDPLGTVSIIDISGGVVSLNQSDVTTLDFTSFNSVPLDLSIRIFGPGATVAQDLEPEYIAVSTVI